MLKKLKIFIELSGKNFIYQNRVISSSVLNAYKIIVFTKKNKDDLIKYYNCPAEKVVVQNLMPNLPNIYNQLKNKKLSLVCSPKKSISRRQDAPSCYDLTTVCYVFKPEYIIDFASICMVNQSWNNPKIYFQINVLFKAEMLIQLKKFNFLKKYIYISTPEIFGSSNKFIHEDNNNFNPSTPYATSKLSAEILLKNYLVTSIITIL